MTGRFATGVVLALRRSQPLRPRRSWTARTSWATAKWRTGRNRALTSADGSPSKAVSARRRLHPGSRSIRGVSLHSSS